MKLAAMIPYTLALTVILALLSGPAGAAASVERLPSNPSFVSLVYYEGAETMTEQFGHIELRLSYGSKPDLFNDRVVGFGPPTDEDQKIAPLSYLGVGPKLPIIFWNAPFRENYEAHALEKMSRVQSLTLDLDATEKARVVEMLNEIFENGYYRGHYNMVLENCATVVAKILVRAGRLSGGVLSFVPEQLAHTLRKHTVEKEVLSSGRDLKIAVLKKYGNLESRLLKSALERRAFEMQLMSMQTELRILAYQRLQTPEAAPLLQALLKTESAGRRKFIRERLARRPILAAQRTFAMELGEKLRSAVVKNGKLIVSTELVSLHGVPNRGMPSPAKRQKIREWTLSELGLKAAPSQAWESGAVSEYMGSEKRVRVWIAEDLGLDPK